MELQIKFLKGESHRLVVNPSITVGDLKKRIQDLSGDSPACQKLSSGNGVNFSNDSSTLSNIGLQSGSSIMVLLGNPVPGNPVEVILKNEKGQTHTYVIQPGETVASFKSKVYNREGVPVDQQNLIYNGKQLYDGKKLEDYSIGSNSLIYLTLRLRGGC